MERMLYRFKAVIIVMAMLSFVLPSLSAAQTVGDSQPVVTREKVDVSPSVTSSQPAKNDTKIPEGRKLSSDDMMLNLIDNLASQLTAWSEQINTAILLVTAIILVVTLLNAIAVFQILNITKSQANQFETTINEKIEWLIDRKIENKFESANQRMLKQIDDVDKELGIIDEKVELFINKNLNNKLKELSRWANQRIEEYLEEDFSKPLEERYLKMEYVRQDTWNEIASHLNRALMENKQDETIKLWRIFFRMERALRECLSVDDNVIFTGLGTLRAFAKDGYVPKNSLLGFIEVLRKQKRLNQDNSDFARQMERELQ